MNQVSLKIVFMGTSKFAVPSLEFLASSGHRLLAVVSQPDRAKGRGRTLTAPPVKEAAMRHNIPVLQFKRIRELEAVEAMKELVPDLIVVVSYGQIIPPAILGLPPLGCVNVHASLLPLYRGAAPVQRALMDGQTHTGVSIMRMDEGLDTGDVLLQETIYIEPEWDHGQLEARLATAGTSLLAATIAGLIEGRLNPTRQDDRQASYAHMIGPKDEAIEWASSAVSIHNQIRALSPQPGAYTLYGGQRIKVFHSRPGPDTSRGEVGEVLFRTAEGIMVQAGSGQLEILEVQKPGKRRMAVPDFLKGFPVSEGSRFYSQEG